MDLSGQIANVIDRRFIDVPERGGARRVHYRVAGSGPPLLMVHQSPRSSAEYERLMRAWSAHFTCIAPDTPGFGQSDPLPGEPEDATIDQFAEALVALLGALGIERTAAYGFHSGGIILVTAMKRAPTHFTGLAVGGYAIWTEAEMALFSDRYLPPFHPQPFGEHLTWLWNRMLEQSWFFPWFAADEAHRLSVAHDDIARVDQAMREMLDAGDAYRAGYGAVLRAPRDIPPPDAEMPPCLITAYAGDPLQEHIDRLGAMPTGWSACKVATPAEHEAASLAFLQALPGKPTPALPTASDRGFLRVKTADFRGLVHWCGDTDHNVLSVPPAGGAAPDRPEAGELWIDLPGHGLSDDWTDKPPTDWSPWAEVIESGRAQLGARDTILSPLPPGDSARLYPDLTPDRFGGHLTRAWQIARAKLFFAPWYEANALHARTFDADELNLQRLVASHRTILNGRAARACHLARQSLEGAHR